MCQESGGKVSAVMKMGTDSTCCVEGERSSPVPLRNRAWLTRPRRILLGGCELNRRVRGQEWHGLWKTLAVRSGRSVVSVAMATDGQGHPVCALLCDPDLPFRGGHEGVDIVQ